MALNILEILKRYYPEEFSNATDSNSIDYFIETFSKSLAPNKILANSLADANIDYRIFMQEHPVPEDMNIETIERGIEYNLVKINEREYCFQNSNSGKLIFIAFTSSKTIKQFINDINSFKNNSNNPEFKLPSSLNHLSYESFLNFRKIGMKKLVSSQNYKFCKVIHHELQTLSPFEVLLNIDYSHKNMFSMLIYEILCENMISTRIAFLKPKLDLFKAMNINLTVHEQLKKIDEFWELIFKNNYMMKDSISIFARLENTEKEKERKLLLKDINDYFYKNHNFELPEFCTTEKKNRILKQCILEGVSVETFDFIESNKEDCNKLIKLIYEDIKEILENKEIWKFTVFEHIGNNPDLDLSEMSTGININSPWGSLVIGYLFLKNIIDSRSLANIYIKIMKMQLDERLAKDESNDKYNFSSIVEKFNGYFSIYKEYFELNSDNEVNKLIKLIEEGESKSLEFKETYRFDVRKEELVKGGGYLKNEVIEAVGAMLNTVNGGTVIIGVDDKNNILGIEKDAFKNNDEYKRTLSQVFSSSIEPSKANLENIEIKFVKIKGKTVVKIDCKKSLDLVVIKIDGKEKAMIRDGATSRALTITEITNWEK